MARVVDLENYAKENSIPIMQHDGIEFLCYYIKTHPIKRILEIGTAIGYSAIKMAQIAPDIQITTIEKDQERYQLARQNVKDFGLEDQIHIIYGDALYEKMEDTYDLIFIDAAKSQYIKFFEKYQRNLNPQGVIVSDNLNFHGLVHHSTVSLSRNVRGLVRKLENYITFLENNPSFKTTFYEVGDGISVSIRNDEKEVL